MEHGDPKNLILSYYTVRRLIAIAGLSLPIILFFDSRVICDVPLKESISAYYYSNLGDILVGILVLLGTFLIFYRGYEGYLDNRYSTWAGVGALGVAFLPCYGVESMKCIFTCKNAIPDDLYPYLHGASAFLFFGCSAVLTGHYFVKNQPKPRRVLYYTCAATILISMIYIGTHFKDDIFLAETIALIAFGTAWLVKGIRKNEKNLPTK